MDFRPEFPPREVDFLRSRARNATLLLDLNECDAGYTPTHWQHSLLPEVYRPKVEVIHDGIDTDLWCRRDVLPRRLGDEEIADDVRIVTYVARGLEAMRGFDVFVRVAKQIAAALPKVVFAVVGGDRVHYGNDSRFVARGKSFREHVLEQEQPDLDRFRFLGRLPQRQLADVFSVSDLHLYLSVPFVLSWSMLNAMACECVVLASDVAPVREVIAHDENGLLGDFFDEEGLAAQAVEVLHDPARFRPLASAARACIEERYSVDRSYPQLERMFERVAGG
jgi:glycosyltransferase involved in cell wall biosynthesis